MTKPKVGLLAPRAYKEASLELRQAVAGGCGPGGLGDYLVPDTLWGLSVRKACNIHDWEYHFGKTQQDKKVADENFLDNMIRLIQAANGWRVLMWLRKRRARKYYKAVRDYGGPFYWLGKDTVYMEVDDE